MGEVLTLEEDPGASGVFGETRSVHQRRRPSDVVDEEIVDRRLESWILAGLGVGRLKFGDGGHQRLWRELAAKLAESPLDVRPG